MKQTSRQNYTSREERSSIAAAADIIHCVSFIIRVGFWNAVRVIASHQSPAVPPARSTGHPHRRVFSSLHFCLAASTQTFAGKIYNVAEASGKLLNTKKSLLVKLMEIILMV